MEEKIRELIKTGYAGVTLKGKIVDRRKVPDAMPIHGALEKLMDKSEVRNPRPVLDKKINFKGLPEKETDKLIEKINRAINRVYARVRDGKTEKGNETDNKFSEHFKEDENKEG